VTRAVETVAIVGRDAPLWLAAAAIERSLGAAGVRVQAIELPSWLDPVDCYSTLPSLASMHRLLGIDEAKMLDATKGVPVGAQRFSSWAKGSPPYLVAYDNEVGESGDLPFAQYWLKGHTEGLRAGVEDYSLGCACARLGRVPLAPPGTAGELSASYGYSLDASDYSEALKQMVVKRGVAAISGRIANVKLNGDRITSLEMAGGPHVEADLFIDASGPDRVLMMRMPGARFDSWRERFGCDRLVAASASQFKNLPAFTQISAFRGGWIGIHPLRDRTAVTAVYASEIVLDQSMIAELPVLARLPLAGEAVVSQLQPGALERAWIGNCVAVGEAAIAIEPLDAIQLHLAQGSISHLVALFPATAEQMPEATAYNQAIRAFASNIGDFTQAHYLLNRRFDEPFWDRSREAAATDTLRSKLDLFSARGEVAIRDNETFSEQNWTSLFLGGGIEPDRYDPRIDLLPDEPLIQKVQQRLRAVAEVAKSMPTVDQFVGAVDQLRAAVVS
jgi:tryptophan halogenase